ncbi:MAG TPA: HAD family hydrolase [Gaiellaceae bacterium]|nr:HAD family hydrolase [Gaiellaceae bacterium]
MLEAVFFDWGSTLSQFTWDDALLAAGHQAALTALGRADEAETFTARFREETLPTVLAPGAADRLDYGTELRKLLDPVTDEQLDAYFDAEHAVWRPARALADGMPKLLYALHADGLAVGVIANTWPDPPRLLRRELEEFGIETQFDAVVLSSEVGVRKPAPAIFERALEELGVDASAALHVGDRLVEDVQGAAGVGMLTAQALWFRIDPPMAEIEPDFMAFTPQDVLGFARTLGR